MITKMQKYTFLVFHKEYESFLEQLRAAGVVHVAEKGEVIADNEQLQQQISRLGELQKTITAVEVCVPQEAKTVAAKRVENVEDLEHEFVGLQADKQQIEQTIQATEKEAERMQIWGDFAVDKLEAIEQNGYHLQFFSCPAAKFNADWATLYNAVQVAEQNGTVYFVTVTRENEQIEVDADEIQFSEKNSRELQVDITGLKHLLAAKQAEIEGWSIANIETLKAEAKRAQQAIDWNRVELSTESVAGETVKLLEGYCPVDKVDGLNELLKKEHIYYTAEDPKDGDAAPIQLKNNFFARLFEPITRLYSLPNYYEIDPTAFFAPFFMLFFGLCLGDGGYGLVVLLAGIAVLWKAPKLKDWGWLAIFMGITTMIVGILTGMFFGIELENVAFLKPVKQYFITDNNFKEACHGYSPMMVFAIAIGIFQILFAMGFKVVKITLQKGFKYAAYDCAWLVFLIDMIVLLAAGDAPKAVTYIIYGIAAVCVLLILFYSNPDRKLLVLNIGGGLWGTYNMASGLLGDVLSYIRLFALGLAGGILGNVFNQLAMQVGGALPAWIGWLPMVLIMVFGHGLNFALALISSVVHPLRLTFVEFYKNAGFEGGGQEYKPFAN